MGIAALHPSYETTKPYRRPARHHSPLTISARLPTQGFQRRSDPGWWQL